MGLFGHHSSDPYGAPANYQALEQLYQLAQSGDREAAQTLRTIASGGTTHGTSVPGWNEDLHWGNNDPANAVLRAAANDLLQGNLTSYQQKAQEGNANYTPWSGGVLADIAPMAVGALLAPVTGGASLLASGLAGAATGGIEAATGLTNKSIESGVLTGGLEGAAGHGIDSLFQGGSGAAGAADASGGGAAPAEAGVTSDGADAVDAAANVGSQDSGLATLLKGAPKAIGRFITKNPTLTLGALSTAANVYGAGQQGRIADQELGLQEAQLQRSLAPRTPFRAWQQNRGTAPGGG